MLFLEGATYELLEVTEETVIHRVETAFQLYLSIMPKAAVVSQIEQGLTRLWTTELSGGCYMLFCLKQLILGMLHWLSIQRGIWFYFQIQPISMNFRLKHKGSSSNHHL